MPQYGLKKLSFLAILFQWGRTTVNDSVITYPIIFNTLLNILSQSFHYTSPYSDYTNSVVNPTISSFKLYMDYGANLNANGSYWLAIGS